MLRRLAVSAVVVLIAAEYAILRSMSRNDQTPPSGADGQRLPQAAGPAADRVDASAPLQRTDEHAIERHAAFLERAREPIGILFIGDSITRRWAEVPDLWARYFGSYQPANFGVGADATQNVLWRLRNGELDHVRPRVVVLLIGANNLPTNTASEVAAAIRTIVAEIRGRLPEVPLLLNAVFPRGPQDPSRSQPDANPYYMDKVRAVNREIADLDDRKMVRFLDIGDRFLRPDGEIDTTCMPDCLHLVGPGFQLWAGAMLPLLREMMR